MGQNWDELASQLDQRADLFDAKIRELSIELAGFREVTAEKIEKARLDEVLATLTGLGTQLKSVGERLARVEEKLFPEEDENAITPPDKGLPLKRTQ